VGLRDVVARRPILPLDHVHIVMYDAKNDRDNNAIFGRVGNSMTCFTLSGHNVKPPDAIFTSAETNDAVYRGVSPKKLRTIVHCPFFRLTKLVYHLTKESRKKSLQI